MICLLRSHGASLLHDSKKDLWHTRRVHEANPLSEVSGLGTGICLVDRHHKPVDGSRQISDMILSG